MRSKRTIKNMGALYHIRLLLLLKGVFPSYSQDETVGDDGEHRNIRLIRNLGRIWIGTTCVRSHLWRINHAGRLFHQAREIPIVMLTVPVAPSISQSLIRLWGFRLSPGFKKVNRTSLTGPVANTSPAIMSLLFLLRRP